MIDHRLIAKAESLAGGEVHDVASMIFLYEGSYVISQMETEKKHKENHLKRVELCEQALRMFVAGKPIKACDAWLRPELAKYPVR